MYMMMELLDGFLFNIATSVEVVITWNFKANLVCSTLLDMTTLNFTLFFQPNSVRII